MNPSGTHAVADAQSFVDAAREAERAGRILDARSHYERAFQLLRPDDAGELAPNLLRWIAWTYATEGDVQVALDILEAAEVAAEARGDEGVLSAVLNTRAGTLFGMGELDEAESLFGRVRRLAIASGNAKFVAVADQNLGTVASIRGDQQLALARFQASLANFEALGEMAYVGPLLNNVGRLQSDLEEDVSARRTLERARTMCVEQDDVHHLIIVDVNRARLMLRAGDPLKALQTVQEARDRAAQVGDDRWTGDILLVSGSAHRVLGSAEMALNLLDRALEVGRKREDVKLIADVVLEQARALRSVGRNRDTLLRLNEARQLFERLRARLDLANVGERLSELETEFTQIVRDWGESIESKDAYTQGHCSRVADFACMLAEAAGLPEADMRWFRMGALLHDVGKVSVPLEVLTKPGKLDEAEWSIMSRHPEFGVELLEGIEFPWDVRPMIRHHHERWDGSGYPDRMAADEIPWEARILTIADIYDALTTTRSYRKAFTHEAAMEIMTSEMGKTVDPALFRLFEEEVTPRILALPDSPTVIPLLATVA